MKQLRKYLPLLLVLLLMLGLAGCGSAGSEEPAVPEVSASTAEEPAAEEEEPAEEPAPEVEYQHGAIDGNVYINEFFGFTFTATDSWTFADEETLRQLNQNVSDIVDNETVTEALKSGSTFIDMQASDSTNPLTNVNLTVTYAPGSAGAGDINDATIEYMTKMYQDAGFEDVSISKTTATVAGENMDALLTTMTVQGNTLVEKQIFFTSNGYLGTFTVSGFEESDCDLLLNQLSK